MVTYVPPREPRRLVLLSFLMLFVELALIRWVGSNVVYLSYFSNFVLLGSFLGIGVGFLCAKQARDFFPMAPVLLALFVGFVDAFPVQIACSGGSVIYFGCSPSGLPIWATLPVVFVAVAAVLAAIAQGVGRAFSAFEPLEAYRLDILGSLAGIATFTALAFLGAPPIGWGLVAIVAFALANATSLRPVQLVAFAAIALLLGKESLKPGDSWSPYYKITVFGVSPGVEALNVNGIPHQMIETVAKRKATEPTYFLPYKRIVANPLRNVLVVGAGNGGDVAIALAAGAKHVDAVEIDPRILTIGRTMNPDRAYQDPRVTAHNDDGRAFLEKTHAIYDLILFALPDSLALVSGQSSLRLESYLFTREAIASARAHLAPGGAYGMYNFYREDWLRDRLASTLERAYGHAPCVDSTPAYVGHFSLLIVGLDARNVRCAMTWNAAAARDVPLPADDDHPFLYLRTRTIPQLYLVAVATILIVSLIAVRIAAGPLAQMRGDLDLFAMGAAFLLLETKNVVQFALLFGTTWFVNALVFFGVLLSVYAAIEITKHVPPIDRRILYVALFASIAVAWAIAPERLLALETPLRFVAAVVLAFTPIFIANLIFTERFRTAEASTLAFGANLLGAMLGGVLEYASLVVGYRALLPLVALIYAFAFVMDRSRRTIARA